MHGSGRIAPLGRGKEAWKWDVTLYESGDGIKASLNRSGRPLDEDSILFHATHSLLADVVDAAGGLEGSIIRLRTAMDRAQKQYIEWSVTTGELPDGGGMRIRPQRMHGTPLKSRSCGLARSMIDSGDRLSIVDATQIKG